MQNIAPQTNRAAIATCTGYIQRLLTGLYAERLHCNGQPKNPRSIGSIFHNLAGYVGTGIGVVFKDSDFNTPAVNVSINDEAFAYQFIAGASKPMSNSIDFFAEYRFLGTNDLLVQRTSPLTAQKIGDFKMESNNVFFGFRWSH